MSATNADATTKVFRVRGLPNEIKPSAHTARPLSRDLGLSAASHVVVSSLATTLDYWETPPSRVATVQFNVSPEWLSTPMRPGQWLVPRGDANGGSLILDTHLLGLTPLNDVEESCHALE